MNRSPHLRSPALDSIGHGNADLEAALKLLLTIPIRIVQAGSAQRGLQPRPATNATIDTHIALIGVAETEVSPPPLHFQDAEPAASPRTQNTAHWSIPVLCVLCNI